MTTNGQTKRTEANGDGKRRSAGADAVDAAIIGLAYCQACCCEVTAQERSKWRSRETKKRKAAPQQAGQLKRLALDSALSYEVQQCPADVRKQNVFESFRSSTVLHAWTGMSVFVAALVS